MNIFHLDAVSIQDAWFQLVWTLMRGDVPKSVYKIDKGSYVGQKRLEFEFVTIQINKPGLRPLIPEIPSQLSIPPPVEGMDYVNDYFARYLMGTDLEDNETYIYGTWLVPGVERVIGQLRDSPGNNQAVISIGGLASKNTLIQKGSIVANLQEHVDTDDYIDPGTGQRDPACLRLVDFRLDQQNTLHMAVYFRSWDLWGGFPANLAALQLVKEYVGQAIGAEDGRIIALSKGLHLYDHCIDVAAERLGMETGKAEKFLDWVSSKEG